jgi:hypothetical protein
MAAPAPPQNVTPTVDANSKITLTWDYDPEWFAFDGTDTSYGGFNDGLWYSSGDQADSFDIQLTRDGNGWVAPDGGSASVNHDGSTSYSGTYGLTAKIHTKHKSELTRRLSSGSGLSTQMARQVG